MTRRTWWVPLALVLAVTFGLLGLLIATRNDLSAEQAARCRNVNNVARAVRGLVADSTRPTKPNPEIDALLNQIQDRTVATLLMRLGVGSSGVSPQAARLKARAARIHILAC